MVHLHSVVGNFRDDLVRYQTDVVRAGRNPLVSGGATPSEDCDLLGKRHSGLAADRLESNRHKGGGEPCAGKAHLIGVDDPPLRYDVEIVGMEGLLVSIGSTPSPRLCAARPKLELVFDDGPIGMTATSASF